MEHEEDEDEEDVDFNPLLKDSPSLEASSSLSSEVEGLDADVIDSGCEKAQILASNQISEIKGNGVDGSNLQEEILVQSGDSFGEHCDPRLEKEFGQEPRKRKLDLISELENNAVLEREYGSSSGADVINDVPEEETNMMLDNSLDDDEDDAICKRTRARYSLVNFTLDELEAFLQETDDDDDLPNVDEEEEYRKFLAAVLQDEDGDDDQAMMDDGNDEDEDNDDDFELEIEEALESDIDDCVVNSNRKDSNSTVRRPETRQNKHQKSSLDGKDKVLELVNKPLRPLVPVLPNATIAPFPSFNGRYSVLDNAPNLPSLPHRCSVNVFTPDQIGQLYCLIHEHVQLLIQVYSLSVLEPSRKNIASQVQGLLSEMLLKRDQVLTWRKFPHPSFCFHPPHIHPSGLDGHPRYWPPQENATGSSQTNDDQRDFSSTNTDSQRSTDPQTCSSGHNHPIKESVNSIQGVQSSCWFPFVGDPILSILDVAPLKLVGKYVDDVSTAVQEQMRRYVEATGNLHSEKQPLFPLLSCPSPVEASAEISKGTTCWEYGGLLSLSSNHRPPKKTLAATLVESTKKQSVALVPKRIAELARQFYPLFNPALFPHKAPPLAVANRVLFTDSEDELLAMGLMECNTDWKAIQQRFLPCKSKHQIFVRQKNRCSSKAPENPIKAVRRLKTSPLTAEEKARIFEGLKAFKLDWMSIWKFIVPYRDPSLLPRQWRIALGTQKSYKLDPNKREKRRLYEWKRRRSKRLALGIDDENAATGGRNEHGEDCMEKDNKVHAHEFLLSDWRPVPSIAVCEPTTSNHNSGWLPGAVLPGESNMEEPDNHGSYESSDKDYHKYYPFSRDRGQSRSCKTAQISEMEILSSSGLASKSSRYEPIPRPYRARRPRSSQMVRLAPELPPVNLPPSVRVISQAVFRHTLGRLPTGTENTVTSPVCRGNSSSDLTNMNQQRKNSNANRGNGSESENEMHSFLFQAPENSRLPCHLLSGANSAPSSYSFFPVVSHQINHAPQFQSSQQVGPSVAGSNKSSSSSLKKLTSCGSDFRPLFQRVDNLNDDFVAGYPAIQLEVNHLELSRDEVPSNGAMNNELDLEINLHSAPRKEKDSTTDGREVVLPSNGGHGYVIAGAGDQSLPDIVMEQEELSDSDEEIEHVEFECEEMADSEGEEESESCPILNRQNKKHPDATQKNIGCSDQLGGSNPGENPEVIERRGKATSRLLDFPGSMEDSEVRSSWLCLNLQDDGVINSVPSSVDGQATAIDGNMGSSSHLNKSLKKVKWMVTDNDHATSPNGNRCDVPRQNKDPVKIVSSSSRVQRKRVGRNPLNFGVDIERSNCRKESLGES